MESGSETVRIRLSELSADVGLRAFGVLSHDELDRARRFIDREFGEMFMARRAFVRYVVGEWLDVAPHQVEFGREPRGKPFVVGHRGIHFNVSHAGANTMVAIGSQRLGIDIETLDAIVDVEGIAERVLSVREGNILSRLGRSRQPAAVLTAWARKEAAAKADGAGLAMELSTIETTPGQRAKGLPALVGSSRLFIWDIDAPENHAAALATASQEIDIDFASVGTREIEGSRLSPVW